MSAARVTSSSLRKLGSQAATSTKDNLPNYWAVGHKVRIDEAGAVKAAYTPTQGQYLAFIYYYTKLNGVAPAEADFQRYFKVSPPSVHQMIVTLEKRSLIERVPGMGRSIRLRLSRDQLPDLL